MGDIKIVPEPEVELDVRIVRINEQEGIIEESVDVTATYQVLANNSHISASGTFTVTLPNVNAGKSITVKNTGTGLITVDGGDFNIDGVSSISLLNQYDVLTAQFDGTQWNILGKSSPSASHFIRFGAKATTVGGSATEAFTITGILSTDLPFLQLINDGTNNVSILSCAVTTDTLTVIFSGDPSSDTIFAYQILRD